MSQDQDTRDPNRFTKANYDRNPGRYSIDVAEAINTAITTSVRRGTAVSRDEVPIVPLISPNGEPVRVDSDVGATRNWTNGRTWHSALDLLPAGPVHASVSGEVVFRGYYNNLAGEVIVIRDDRGTPNNQYDDRYWMYDHLVIGSANNLAVGTLVNRGDVIGITGQSGNASRYPVLHNTVRMFGPRADERNRYIAESQYNPPRAEVGENPSAIPGSTPPAPGTVQPIIYGFEDFNRVIVPPYYNISTYRTGDTIAYRMPDDQVQVARTQPPVSAPVPGFPPGVFGGDTVPDQTGPGNNQRGILAGDPTLPPF